MKTEMRKLAKPTGYYGFPSKKAFEDYYSKPLPQWEIDAMEQYAREAEAERKERCGNGKRSRT